MHLLCGGLSPQPNRSCLLALLTLVFMVARRVRLLVHKPYGMLSRFRRTGLHSCLSDLDFPFPHDAYPIGRLDHDSEGLLLITNDALWRRWMQAKRVEKCYWVQVAGWPGTDVLRRLQEGVVITVRGVKYRTKPALVRRINSPPVSPRNPPLPPHRLQQTTWLDICLQEGKNRQIRKMVAAVGCPCLRLIRYRIGEYELGGMQPGEVRMV